MSTVIALGYPDETTASSAAEEAHRMARDLTLEPEAIAVISRDRDGRFQVSTNHHPVAGGASWGMFWGLLFGFLFFVPVFGMAVGAGLGAVMGRVTKSGIDRQFRDQVREILGEESKLLDARRHTAQELASNNRIVLLVAGVVALVVVLVERS